MKIKIINKFSLKFLLFVNSIIILFSYFFYYNYQYYQRLSRVQNTFKASGKNYSFKELSTLSKMRPPRNSSEFLLPDLKFFYSLRELNLCLNTLSTSSLEHLGNITQLEKLSLRMASFQNFQFLKNLKQLKVLDLSHLPSYFSRDELYCLSELPTLYSLDVSENPIEDKDLLLISKFCPQLVELYLGRTRITDEGIAYIAKLKKLEILELRGVGITHIGLEKIASSLQEIYALDLAQDISVKDKHSLEKKPNILLSGPQLAPRDITILKKFQDLSILSITRTTDKEITFLTELKNLKILSLGEIDSIDLGSIQNLSVLKKLSFLRFQTFSISKEEIIQILEKIKTLQIFCIIASPTSSLTPLELHEIQKNYPACKINLIHSKVFIDFQIREYSKLYSF